MTASNTAAVTNTEQELDFNSENLDEQPPPVVTGGNGGNGGDGGAEGGGGDSSNAVVQVNDPLNNKIEEFSSFEDMKLDNELLRGIYAYGFTNPSPIQARGIVPIANGRDVLGQAQSGTGKTAMFTIGMLQKLHRDMQADSSGKSNEEWALTGLPRVNCLVLSPTRELANQTYNVIRKIAQYLTAIKSDCFVGGVSMFNDKHIIHEKRPQIMCGTPGRINDIITRKKDRLPLVDTHHLATVIMDEADELLSQGFAQQIHDMFEYVPASAQVVMISATMSPLIVDLSDKIMKNQISILMKTEELTLDGIKQYYLTVNDNSTKQMVVTDLYDRLTISQAIIFCNSRNTVDELAEYMKARDFEVSSLHSATERHSVMAAFENGTTRVLITTDILARGIDVQGVSMVLNYDMPMSPANYLHRIGRSGRYGRKGLSINFVGNRPRDLDMLKQIQDTYRTELLELPENFEDFLK